MALKLSRGYQNQAQTDCFEAWESGINCCFLVMATGSGKTFTAVEMVKEFLFQGKRTMWIAHRKELIQQAQETMYHHKIFAGVIMGSSKTNYSLPVQVCSIDTIVKRVDLPPCDLIVIDEGHHVSSGSQYEKVCALYPDALILILTATPYRLSGEGFLNVFPERSKKLIVAASMHYLIEQGWLVPFEYYITSIPDMTGVKLNSRGDYEENETRKAMEMAPIVESYEKHAAGLQGICFAINVAHSIELRDKYRRKGITADHIDGKTNANERDQILRDFKLGFIKVLCNCGITTEGTDLPNTQFVQHAAPTLSLSLALQKSGRVSRAEPGLVDQFATPLERKYAIASSSKPSGIVLDNAGIAIEHMLPDYNHNWVYHYEGHKSERKNKKADILDVMEMLVFVMEDEKGNTFRTNKLKEVEGLKLIRVDKSVQRKIVNLVAVKKFDEYYAKAKQYKNVKKPGYVAIQDYFDYCAKSNTFIPPEVWDYFEQKLIKEPAAALEKISSTNAQFPGTVPAAMLIKAQKNAAAQSVSRTFLSDKRKQYSINNASQTAEYIAKKLNLTL